MNISGVKQPELNHEVKLPVLPEPIMVHISGKETTVKTIEVKPVIEVPVEPAIKEGGPVPTMSQWGFWFLIVLFLLHAFFSYSKKGG